MSAAAAKQAPPPPPPLHCDAALLWLHPRQISSHLSPVQLAHLGARARAHNQHQRRDDNKRDKSAQHQVRVVIIISLEFNCEDEKDYRMMMRAAASDDDDG